MKKKNTPMKSRQNKREDMFIRVLIGLGVLLIVLVVVSKFIGNDDTGYVVTEDGHVHASDGTHLGTMEELGIEEEPAVEGEETDE